MECQQDHSILKQRHESEYSSLPHRWVFDDLIQAQEFQAFEVG